MKNIQFIGLSLVILGSFLPLVKIPLMGYWSYWDIDPYLSSLVWLLCLVGFYLIQNEKLQATRILSAILILLFLFTIFAVQLKSKEFFSFLSFNSWQTAFAGMVKIAWGWNLEFIGAIMMLFGFNKNKRQN